MKGVEFVVTFGAMRSITSATPLKGVRNLFLTKFMLQLIRQFMSLGSGVRPKEYMLTQTFTLDPFSIQLLPLHVCLSQLSVEFC